MSKKGKLLSKLEKGLLRLGLFLGANGQTRLCSARSCLSLPQAIPKNRDRLRNVSFVIAVGNPQRHGGASLMALRFAAGNDKGVGTLIKKTLHSATSRLSLQQAICDITAGLPTWRCGLPQAMTRGVGTFLQMHTFRFSFVK